MRTRTLPLLFIAAVWLSGCSAEAPQAPPRDVTASVLVAETAAVPGRLLTLGWRFQLRDGWHLYTNGRSDTGLPPTVELDLPEGWEAGDLRWPVGHRLLAPGDILDHVYEDEVTLFQTVRVGSEGLDFGAETTLRARLTWLACREICVPGDTVLAVTLPVEPHAQPGPGSTPLTQVLRNLPREPREGEMATAWDGSTLRVRVPGADHLEFHPAAEGGELVDPIGDAVVDGGELTLRFRTGPARGVIVASGPGGRRHLTLDQSRPDQGDAP